MRAPSRVSHLLLHFSLAAASPVLLQQRNSTLLSTAPLVPSTTSTLTASTSISSAAPNSYPAPIAASSTLTASTLSAASPSPASFVDPANGVLQLESLSPRSPDPVPTDCENNGSGNTGCNNSGIGNSGTNNSGINNCGTNHSGIGEGCDGSSDGSTTGTATTATAAADSTAGTSITTVLTGPTSTVTVVIDPNHRRSDCAYWEAQGFVCSSASNMWGNVPARAWAAAAMAAGAGAWLVV